MPCSGLLGNWSEVEPIEGVTLEEADEDKVRETSPAKWLTVEPGRMTIVTGAERNHTRINVEKVSDGSCMLHARDSLGKPVDIAASFVSERLMRLHNTADYRSAPTLFERR